MRCALLLCFAACSTVGDFRRPYTAKLRPAIEPLPYVAHADVAGVLVWANTHLWREAPSDTESWATVIGIDLQNAGDRAVPFRLEDLRLVNEKGEEAAPFFAPAIVLWPPNREQLEEALAKHPPNTQDVESLVLDGWGNHTTVFIPEELRRGGPSFGEWSDLFGISNLPRDWTPDVRFVRVPYALKVRSLFGRTLNPGERASGYLVFPRVTPEMKHVELVWRPDGGADEGRIPFRVERPGLVAMY